MKKLNDLQIPKKQYVIKKIGGLYASGHNHYVRLPHAIRFDTYEEASAKCNKGEIALSVQSQLGVGI